MRRSEATFRTTRTMTVTPVVAGYCAQKRQDDLVSVRDSSSSSSSLREIVVYHIVAAIGQQVGCFSRLFHNGASFGL